MPVWLNSVWLTPNNKTQNTKYQEWILDKMDDQLEGVQK